MIFCLFNVYKHFFYIGAGEASADVPEGDDKAKEDDQTKTDDTGLEGKYIPQLYC